MGDNVITAEGEATSRHDGLFRIGGLENVLFGFRSGRPNLTKGERAYAEVRRAIVTHALPAATPLDEATLLEFFGFGRTPLREALKRLSYEGLLVWRPHQAPMIRDIGWLELPSLYETRRLLEYQVAENAARHATAADIRQMEIIQQKLQEASGQGYAYEAVELDYELHSAIATASKNRFLAEASNTLNLQSLRVWYLAHQILGTSNVDKLHGRLVHAIATHDPALARALAAAHIDRSLERQRALQARGAVVPT